MGSRAYLSASSNFFSEESEVKRCKLDVEEHRLLLDEKAQVVQMVTVSVYTPRTAQRKIEEIDQCMKPSALKTTPDPQTPGQSPSGSYNQYWTRSLSLDRHSISWGIEDPDKSLDDDDEEA
jgi:hypothetical protein